MKSKNQFRTTEELNLDSVPVPVLCYTMQKIMSNLVNRGFPIRDFDNKDKTVKQIEMIGEDIYFFSNAKGE